MAKVLGPLLSLRAWGTFGGVVVYRRGRGMSTAMGRSAPRNPNTVLQQEQRVSFAAAVSSWRALPDASKVWWVMRAVGMATSGYNLYVKNYLLGMMEE